MLVKVAGRGALPPPRSASSTPEGLMAITATDSKKFKDMGAGEKIVFTGKLVVFLCSFGFAFPLLLND